MSYIQPVDPNELAARYSTEDTLDPIHSLDEDWVLPRLEKIKSVLHLLPGRETDLVSLYFFHDKKQMDIAEIFGITQAAVSYRIKRALDRIKFLVEMPDLSKDDIYKIMTEVMPTDLSSQCEHHSLGNSMSGSLVGRYQYDMHLNFPSPYVVSVS